MLARLHQAIPRPLAKVARRGFTLLETSLALVIVGVGVLAFVEAQTAFIRQNNWSSEAATAAYLANEIRELSRRLPRHDPVIGLYIDAANGNRLVGWGLERSGSTLADINDIDDLDGMTFGEGGTFAGPINAMGEVIPAITVDGDEITGVGGTPQSLAGWSQRVYVEKVDPLNFGTARSDAYLEAASGNNPGRTVDQFPLRVTVVVMYQGPTDGEPQEITRVMWVVTP